MPDSSDPYNLNLFSNACLVSGGAFEPNILREEGVHVRSSCENPLGDRIVTCKHPVRDKYVDEVGGLALDKRLEATEISLPSYIPVLDGSLVTLPHSTIPSSAFGLTLIDVLRTGVKYSHGTWREQENISFKLDLLLHQSVRGKTAILFPFGQDTLLEWLWYKREDIHLFKQLRMMGFHLTMGMNFSVMKGECAFAQRLNQKKDLEFAYLAQEAGIPAMPHIYAVNEFHIETWVQYLLKNPEIKYFCVNSQLQKSKEDRDTVVKSILAILQRIPWDIHVVIFGFPLSKIHEFGAMLGRLHFADKVATKYALGHRRIKTDLVTKGMSNYRSSDSVATLITNNINQRRIFIELIKRDVLKGYVIPDEFKEIFQQAVLRDSHRYKNL